MIDGLIDGICAALALRAVRIYVVGCDFFGLGSVVPVPRAGDRRYGIVRIEEDTLSFGRLSPVRDGSSPEKRPLELDPVPYPRADR